MAGILNTRYDIATKQNQLTIKNSTNGDVDDFGIPGFVFKLIWSRDVHGDLDRTDRLEPDNSDTKKSRGIGNGDNYRHFDIELRLLYKDLDLFVGTFTHSIYAGPLSNGEKDETKIRFNADTWYFYREYDPDFTTLPPTYKTEIIGPLPASAMK